MFDIGSSLREARVRQSLDFPELEERTKIRPKYLRALEDERFDILPAPTYVRGFLRSYADALGLDGQPFVDEYKWRFAGTEEGRVPGLAVDGQTTAPITKARGRMTLVIRATQGSSWMEVRAGSSSGQLLYSGTLERGQRKEFEARRVQLALADPQNVLVRRNGNRVELPAGTSFVVTSRRIAPASS